MQIVIELPLTPRQERACLADITQSGGSGAGLDEHLSRAAATYLGKLVESVVTDYLVRLGAEVDAACEPQTEENSAEPNARQEAIDAMRGLREVARALDS